MHTNKNDSINSCNVSFIYLQIKEESLSFMESKNYFKWNIKKVKAYKNLITKAERVRNQETTQRTKIYQFLKKRKLLKKICTQANL